MPIFIAALIGGLVSAAGSFVGRILIALGVGYVTYQGIDLLLTFVEDKFFTSLLSLDSQIIAIMGLLKIGSAFNVIVSAVLARLVLSGIVNGSITKIGIKS